MTSTCVEEVHRVVHQHGTRAKEERQGLLGPEIPTTIMFPSSKSYASVQVFNVFAAAAFWRHQCSYKKGS